MNFVKELLFPRRCAVCDRLVKIGKSKICPGCKGVFTTISAPWCMKCGKELNSPDKEYCMDCSRGNHLFTRGRAVFTYNSVAASIYRFKYRGRQEYVEYYCECATKVLSDEKEMKQADAIIPVPLHYKRLRQRGYNQAELFAKTLGKAWNIPVNAI